MTLRFTGSFQTAVNCTAVDTVSNTSTHHSGASVGRAPEIPPSTSRNSNSVEPSLHFSVTSNIIERGHLHPMSQHTFVLMFETLPWWILAIHSHFVSSIIIVGFESLSALYHHLSAHPHHSDLFNKAFLRLGLSKLHFVPQLTTIELNSILLVSGSISFFENCLDNPLLINNKLVYVLDKHYIKRDLPRCSHPLRRLKHWEVGGPTSFVGLVSYGKFHISPRSTKLRRVMRHFLDFSQRPRCRQTLHMQGTVLDDSKRLPVHEVRCFVQHKSHFVSSGIGVRHLTPTELACIFGVSSALFDRVSVTSFPFIPVQILDAAIYPLLTTSTVAPSPSVMLTLPSLPKFTGTFVKGVGVFPPSWSTVDYHVEQVAKSDDAEPVFRHWDERITILLPHVAPILPLFRRMLMRRLYRSLYLEFIGFLRNKYNDFHRLLERSSRTIMGGDLYNLNPTDEVVEFSKDRIAGVHALHGFCNSSFSAWEGGSALLFWRWPPNMQTIARDGFVPYVHGHLPRNKKRQRPIAPDLVPLFFTKLRKFIIKDYISPKSSVNPIVSKVDYFPVPKGEDDIRPVFNGTSCGLNKTVFAPNFYLPSADSLCDTLHYEYTSVDIDLGEMFNNYPLHPSLKAVSGIDLSQFREEIMKHFPDHIKSNPDLLYSWSRVWMGLRPAPFWSCRFYYFIEEFFIGDRKNTSNVYHWDKVVFNLPGSPSFNPTLPFVFKWDTTHQRIATSIKAYVDDLRIIAANVELAWQASRQTAARIQRLGSQDAPRKRRIEDGPWTGTMFSTKDGVITKSVTLKKWMKAKTLVMELHNEMESNSEIQFSYKRLEQARGFLCHLAMTYSIIFPYLKGFHLSLCQHLPKRNEDGWKLSDLEWIGHIELQAEKEGLTDKEKIKLINQVTGASVRPPSQVKPVPHFKVCLDALVKFFKQEYPPKVCLRSKNVLMAVHGFADASGTGFGSSIQREDELSFRLGVWGSDESQESSNWREFENLVSCLEEEEQNGKLEGALVILAVDNSTVESCIYKGNSSSPKLYDLILRFKTMELRTGSRFIVSHVAGERMKRQGTDGLSRGCLHEGIGAGEAMLSFCPWHLDVITRSPPLKAWIESWAGKATEFLEPKQWFERGFIGQE